MFLWARIRTVRRLHFVVDRDRRTALELDLAARDDFRAFTQAGEDGHLVAARGTGRHERLLHDERVGRQLRTTACTSLVLARVLRRIAVLRGLGGLGLVGLAFLLHHEYRLAIRVVDDGGLRQSQVTLFAADIDIDV